MKNTRDAIPPFGAAHGYAAGDNVEICDGSEAHGDKGKVLWVQDDGLIIVELEAGCVWPVTEHELKPHNAPTLARAGEDTAITNPLPTARCQQ